MGNNRISMERLMTTTTAEKTAAAEAPKEAQTKGAVAVFQKPRLPYHPAIEERFGVKAAEWKALVEAVFPLAQSVDSVVLALSYCKARKLDPFKRVVHIVPIWDKNYVAPNGKKGRYVDTIWPGIGELRTTAFRTKQYAGADVCQFGPMMERTFTSELDNGERRNITVKFAEWAQLTVYRMIDGQRVPIPGPRVYWLETYSRMGRTELPNEMWQKRPIGQHEKCAEAAALRRAFPEELGDEHIDDEAGAHFGPDHAKDVNPRPTRSDAPESAEAVPPEPAHHEFVTVDFEGNVETHPFPPAAISALRELFRDAVRRGPDAIAAAMENNSEALAALRMVGEIAVVDQLEAMLQAGAATQKLAGTKAEPQEPEPPSPRERKRAEWPPRVEFLKKRLRSMGPQEREAFLAADPDIAFIEAYRTADWEAIKQIHDEMLERK
jgi:phage recombination protein Bet